MRILFKGTVHPSAIAKSIKTALAVRDVHLGLRRCEEILARMCGYANWHELRQVSLAAGAEHSPKDGTVGEEVAAERRRQFVDVMTGFGRIGSEIAASVIDEVRPTGERLRLVKTDVATPAATPWGWPGSATLFRDRLVQDVLTRYYVMDDDGMVYAMSDKDLRSLEGDHFRAPEFAGRRMSAFWLSCELKDGKPVGRPEFATCILKFGAKGQYQEEADERYLSGVIELKEAGHTERMPQGDVAFFERRYDRLFGSRRPDENMLALAIADLFGEYAFPPVRKKRSGYKPSAALKAARKRLDDDVRESLKDPWKFHGRREQYVTYMLLETGPVVLTAKWKEAMEEGLPMPQFAGKRIPIVETWCTTWYEGMFHGFFMDFDADGCLIEDDYPFRRNSLNMTDESILWRRANAWRPEPETLEPLFLDVMVRMKQPGGRRLPTLTQHLERAERKAA